MVYFTDRSKAVFPVLVLPFVASYVCSICACLFLSVSSSSLCLGRAAGCDCDTPWTLLLPFFYIHI